ncbi:MAG: PAS domain-containing sensor histidine kinase [Puniceicoccaceae bacterium]|nr:MAG: PAS domain-containing sensor histidine kinase [Puniceicoccaceae bacterium]
MVDWLRELCGTGYMPHGHCYFWRPELVWLHAVSDGLIALAYFSIPLALFFFVRKRPDVPYVGVFLLFAAFIIACGTTHVFSVWTIWNPAYWISGLVKVATAGVSLATALFLVRIMPEALKLPSPETLRRLNTELDLLVRERTAELSAANDRLRSEARQREAAEDQVRRLNLDLARKVEELQTLVELLPAGVAISRQPDRDRITANASMAGLLGVERGEDGSLILPAESAPTPFRLVVDNETIPLDELPARAAPASTPQPAELPVAIERADGSRVEALCRAVTLRDHLGNNAGAISVIIDITRQREAERERLEFERKLQDTQRLESLGLLAGGIAHDFNNLLTGILGNASILHRELPGPVTSVNQSIRGIESAAQRAAELCRQMLAYAGKGRFVVRPINLNLLIEETIELIEVSIPKTASLQRNLPPDLPAIEGDATQIRQVLMNLVINAAEALEDKRGLVSIATSRQQVTPEYLARITFRGRIEAGDYVSLEISDNGRGIAREQVDRIFDPFYTTKFTGRGLGLSAVLGIVNSHHGAIKVYSEPGRGTTFKLLFPASEAQPPSKAEVVQAHQWHGTGRILVIDDEPAVRQVADLALTNAGFEVVLAEDGEKGLRILEETPRDFEVVLLDLTMPKLSGEDVLRRLRDLSPDLPVILMSGFNEQAAIERFVGRGIASFLPKPFTLDSLLEKIRAAMAKT